MTLLPKDKHYSRHTPSGLTNSIFLRFVRIDTVRLLYTICNISRIFLYYVYALSTTVPAPHVAAWRRDVNVAAPHHRRGKRDRVSCEDPRDSHAGDVVDVPKCVWRGRCWVVCGGRFLPGFCRDTFIRDPDKFCCKTSQPHNPRP